MSTEDRTTYGGYDEYATDGSTEYTWDDSRTDDFDTEFVDDNETEVVETKADVKTAPAKSGGGKAAAVAGGMVAGVAMGAAGAYAGNSILNDNDAPVKVDEPTIEDIENAEALENAEVLMSEEVVAVEEQAGVAPDYSQQSEPAVSVAQAEPVPVASAVTDDMSFSEAFAAARSEVGPGGVFEWHGNTYNTYYKDEWDAMSDAEQNAFQNNAYHAGENLTQADNISDTASMYADEPVVAYVDESDNDVRIIGVMEENVDGQSVYVGAMELDGENVMLIDADHNGYFDYAFADVDGNGELSDMEILDISGDNVSVEDFAIQSMMDVDNDLMASNDMPDYMNDADVSMC